LTKIDNVSSRHIILRWEISISCQKSCDQSGFEFDSVKDIPPAKEHHFRFIEAEVTTSTAPGKQPVASAICNNNNIQTSGYRLIFLNQPFQQDLYLAQLTAEIVVFSL
jgi:hypothetical protein